ncbi:MAG: DsrE family protein [Betaproteobacteria bacterium]|nr:DsrE family protein [Betaproteobacteria bacterium]
MHFVRLTSRLLALLACACIAATAPAQAQSPAGKNRIVFQVSDNDPARWNLALNNAKNVQSDLGVKNVTIEIVAYGPGIAMLRLESPVATRIKDAQSTGINIVACENTLTNQKLSKEDMLPALSYVPAGVVQLMQRQQQGYAYIRP